MSKVKHQSYYKRNGIEVKDIIRDVFNFFGNDLTGFEAACIYNILKYLLRYKFKGISVEDLEKAKTYLNWLEEETKQYPIRYTKLLLPKQMDLISNEVKSIARDKSITESEKIKRIQRTFEKLADYMNGRNYE